MMLENMLRSGLAASNVLTCETTLGSILVEMDYFVSLKQICLHQIKTILIKTLESWH